MAGPDQTVNAGVLVQLEGSASFDPDGDLLTFEWTQAAGVGVALNNADSATPTFTASDTGATLTFDLIISDGDVTATDSVSVFVRLGDTQLVRVTEVPNFLDISDDPLQSEPFDPSILTEPPSSEVEVESGGSFALMREMRWHAVEEFELASGQSREFPVSVEEPALLMARAAWFGASAPVELTVSAQELTLATGSAFPVPPDRGTVIIGVEIATGSVVTVSITNPGGEAVTVQAVVGTLALSFQE